MKDVLKLRRVEKAFGGVQALSGVDLAIATGEVCCLLGENGSGKSTLIKTLSGVHAPDRGEVLIDGIVRRDWRPIDAIVAGIDVIYQDFSLFPNLTVMENLVLPRQVAAKRRVVNWREMRTEAARVVQDFAIDIDLDRRVENLSVAQRQLAAIARALLRVPRLLVMDEPTSALATKEIGILLDTVRRLKERGVSVLFVSHKLDEVMQVADHVVVLRNGRTVFDERARGAKRAELVRLMVDRDLHEGKVRVKADRGPPLLEVRQLGRRGYYRDISFDLHAGEILGVTGQLDSGRTALALTLYGMLPPDTGSMVISGQTVALDRVSTALEHGIALVPEDRLTEGLFLPRSVGSNMTAAILPALRNRWGLIDVDRRVAMQTTWLRQLSIKASSPEAPVTSLSGGNQQRVVLAKALARKPRILVLNGPTAGVDVGSKDEIHRIIERLSREGLGVFLVSDDAEELLRLCDRILVMSRGQLADTLEDDSIAEAAERVARGEPLVHEAMT